MLEERCKVAFPSVEDHFDLRFLCSWTGGFTGMACGTVLGLAVAVLGSMFHLYICCLRSTSLHTVVRREDGFGTQVGIK